MSRAKQLTDDHWNNYVGPLLTAAGAEEKVIALCAFMYKSSGIHFYKHAQEDAVEAARGALANDAAHKAPSLCDSEVLDLSLPSIILEGDGEACRRKYQEEMDEWRREVHGSLEYLTELWDVLQAVQTWISRDPSSTDAQWEMEAIPTILQAHLSKGRPVREAKSAMLVKNAARNYYAPEVCKIILESNGERWRQASLSAFEKAKRGK